MIYIFLELLGTTKGYSSKMNANLQGAQAKMALNFVGL